MERARMARRRDGSTRGTNERRRWRAAGARSRAARRATRERPDARRTWAIHGCAPDATRCVCWNISPDDPDIFFSPPLPRPNDPRPRAGSPKPAGDDGERVVAPRMSARAQLLDRRERSAATTRVRVHAREPPNAYSCIQQITVSCWDEGSRRTATFSPRAPFGFFLSPLELPTTL